MTPKILDSQTCHKNHWNKAESVEYSTFNLDMSLIDSNIKSKYTLKV